ncbi:AbrB family transcriptional regulator [Paracoccus yeei]|uniref:AbrB family transcriptional regulator n=1 Tax=Paracoccus yeei TaxID=147645 RepID=UPI003BF81698
MIAQILVGASLGARLRAEIFVRLPRVALAASLSTLLLSAVMLVAVSPFLILVMGVDAVTATLALAPGGIGEMLATAQALHVLVPVVLGFQFVRSLLTNLAAPVLLAWLVPSPRP